MQNLWHYLISLLAMRHASGNQSESHLYLEVHDFAYNSPSLPCCRDRFGEQSCQALRKTQPAHFEKRCLTDHDFYTLGCCGECRKYIELNSISPEDSKSLLKAPVICRDKHSLSFCRRFKATGMGKFSCGDAEFAVRVCRHTCGYCNDALYDGRNTAPLCAANVMTSLGPNYAFLRNRLQWNTY